MMSGPLARLCHAAALGFGVLALFDAALLGHAWFGFAAARADAFTGEWPTFSRALTLGDPAVQRWLAGIAGAGLLAGGVSVAVMLGQLAAAHPRARAMLAARMLLACAAAALGPVHYFHVAIRLSMNNDLHMLLSYTFFFGMSGVILADLALSSRYSHRVPAGALDLLKDARRRCGFAMLWVGAAFLSTYLLKDAAANPWPVATQRVFVVAETSWIVVAHLYGLLYLPAARSHFRARIGAYAALEAPAKAAA